MRYIHRFRIGNLKYVIYTDSLKLKTFFSKAYSLFDGNILINKLPSKNIVIKARAGNKKNINKVILDTDILISKNLIENLRGTVLFLHGSCIVFKNKYLIFLGKSFQGKSTAAAMLRDKGAIILSDDFVLIDYKSNSALKFPTLASVRRGHFTALQKKYLKPVFKKFSKVNESILPDMSNKEFRAYYHYNKALYSKNMNAGAGFKKIAIVLKKNKKNPGRLNKINFPETLNALINSLFYMPEHILKKNLKQLIDISSEMDFYSLESRSAKEALRLLSRIL